MIRKRWPLAAALIATASLTACGGGESKGPTERERIGTNWKYETQQGVKLAYLGSANSVATMTAPDTFAVLLLQKMRNGETGVTVKAVGAPFFCDLSDCTVAVSADGGAAKTWQGRMTDNKDGIEIPPARDAYDTIRKAKALKITVGLGPKEKQAFDFNVAGLEWK